MNPMQMLNMFKQAQNPFTLMSQMCGNNTQMQGIVNALQNKSPQEWEQYAKNLAQSRNIDLKQFLSQFGISV